ncbi:hypothetical protein Nepgr_010320 [Nepenthes gracilis]|uniref:DYW domain-containing protein n=1 Tax=Nepenthes gracilis TaxID=150966 RepID=A0AAD3SC71_NEPGR|nr:hypothetical protein Nepgr_010320 [Nepenthes gracilis]
MSRPLLSLYRYLSTLSAPIPAPSPQIYLLQCNKRIREFCQLGRIDEARQVFDRMTQKDSVTWNSMISGYASNRRITEAQLLFDAFPGKNVKTWTALLTGFGKMGRIKEARLVFESMPERNIVSWNAMISACVQNGDLGYARKLFDEMPERNVASWNSLITGYCHSCMMRDARGLFDVMPQRNLVSWVVMISGYVQINCFEEAWSFFVRLHGSGEMLDQSVFVVAFSAMMGLSDLDLIESLRSFAVKAGYEEDVVVGTSILNAYTKNGSLDIARHFFETMPERNEYSWSTMIAAFSHSGRLDDAIALYMRSPQRTVCLQTAMMTAYTQNGRIQDAEKIFNEISTPNIVTWNSMIAGYLQNGMLEEADDMFTRMPARNSASWAAMIAGFAQNGQGEIALDLFSHLHRSGNSPNHSCFTSSLFACANLGVIGKGKQIHALTIKTVSQYNSYVGNSLISMYAKCKNVVAVSKVFNTMEVKDMVSWNSLITAFSENDMLDDARAIFEKMPKRDVVSWTAILSAYVQTGHVDVALQMFLDMMERGMKPSQLTVTSILSACGVVGATKLGEQIHGQIFKLGFDSLLFVNNALITMYFKCGSEDGFCIFQDMSERDIVTWNAVLAGCAQNGFGKEAVKIFARMEAENILCNEITFLEILCACSRAGLLDEGWAYFNSMHQVYGIQPLVYHYTCMVDLLGRAGELSKAEALIESMPVEPDSVIWEALLGACRIHNNMELAERVAKNISLMKTNKAGTYVLLSNMYAFEGRWDKVREMRDLMKVHKVSKEPGISWIQIKNKLHSFRTADKTHDLVEEIYSLLKEYHELLKMLGYVPDTNFVLHDVEEEQKEDGLLYHSEKLAVALGILSTPKGSPIQIMKNLRTCGDCHTFMKFMSRVTQRKITVRDRARYHHFRDGFCSCGDYW